MWVRDTGKVGEFTVVRESQGKAKVTQNQIVNTDGVRKKINVKDMLGLQTEAKPCSEKVRNLAGKVWESFVEVSGNRLF